MNKAIIDLNHSTANKILKLAWAIEIIAALVSFSIGFFLVFGDTGLSTEETINKGGYISGLLFFLIGVIELSRIPLVISIYRSVKIWWKIVGTVFLIIVMFVTFESMLVGFEINSTFMTQKQNVLLNQLEKNYEKIDNMDSKIEEISTLNENLIRENFERDLLFFQNQRKERQNEIENRINSNEDKRKTRLDENVDKIQETNQRREDILKPYIEKRDELREKTNSESQQLLRDKRDNKINQRDNLNTNKSKAKEEALFHYEQKIANQRWNASKEESTKKENLANVSKQLSDEKKDLQSYIDKELTEKKWGYRGRIKIRQKESSERQGVLSNQASMLRDDIAVLASNLTKQLNLSENKHNNQLSEINKDFVTLEKEINQDIDKLNTELEERILLDTGSVKEELVKIELDINNINKQFDEDIKKINSERSNTGSQFDKLISILDEENNTINGEFNENKRAIEEERDLKIKSLESQNERVEELQNVNNTIKITNIDLKDEYNILATGSIIHNFALKIPLWMYSACGVTDEENNLIPAQSAADISSDCLDFTETIWFGAMALVVAMTGTAVAFGSEVLRTTYSEKRHSIIGITLLRILRFVRRPRIKKVVETKTVKQIDTVVKEVIKEVPVEKVVTTEVIKEKTILKPVHIPVYTNDPALLNLSNNEKKDKKDKSK